MELTHFNKEGRARMVDVSGKAETSRTARAEAKVYMAPSTMEKIKSGRIGKGDVLAVAEVAGIMAAKKNSDLIPMCHPIMISGVDISFEIVDGEGNDSHSSVLKVMSEVRCQGKTGVEMEALTAVSVASLTVYDMCKAVQRDMIISDIRLIYKDGGKSGVFEVE